MLTDHVYQHICAFYVKSLSDVTVFRRDLVFLKEIVSVMARILSVFPTGSTGPPEGCAVLLVSNSSGGSPCRVQSIFAPISSRTCCPRDAEVSVGRVFRGEGLCCPERHAVPGSTLCSCREGGTSDSQAAAPLSQLLFMPKTALHFQLTCATYSFSGASDLVKEPVCQKAFSVQFFPYQVVKLWDVISCILFTMTAMKPFKPVMQIKCDLNVIPKQKHPQQLQRPRSHLITCKTNASS